MAFAFAAIAATVASGLLAIGFTLAAVFIGVDRAEGPLVASIVCAVIAAALVAAGVFTTRKLLT